MQSQRSCLILIHYRLGTERQRPRSRCARCSCLLAVASMCSVLRTLRRCMCLLCLLRLTRFRFINKFASGRSHYCKRSKWLLWCLRHRIAVWKRVSAHQRRVHLPRLQCIDFVWRGAAPKIDKLYQCSHGNSQKQPRPRHQEVLMAVHPVRMQQLVTQKLLVCT